MYIFFTYAFGADGAWGAAAGALGALGAAGAPEPPIGVGALGGVAASGWSSGALQNGHVTGTKFGETIFLPHDGQINGPEETSGGLKHMINPPFIRQHLGKDVAFRNIKIIQKRKICNKQATIGVLKQFVDSHFV